ncbi:MAG: glycosyl transferase family 1 [Candidatus Kapabacteria bacterium]|nr:glycosyl transferase family 1 [Candidatus Kapabacteria bacterium]MCS7169242.1 glycosyl transferase family 1 [Candidatus Kapabacteria bacterium]MDW7996143.1 glycosyl transferase family 1 [Bacteroidota bacterium]MDW8225458.1 glycosyl transferase family 1 [Bacteroidota bacterium]
MGTDPRRRVLVIAYYFPPMGTSGVLRVAKFVKYLPEYGWEPVVLTATPTAYFAFDETLLQELEQRRIAVYRTPGDGNPWWIRRLAASDKTIVLPAEGLNALWLRWSQLRWLPDRAVRWKQEALQLGWQLIREYEPVVLFATAPPFTDFLVAAELAERSGLPYVVDYRDPWVGDPERWYPTPWHRHAHRRLERSVLIRMACATVVARGLKEQLLREYPDVLTYDDVSIIPHGYDSEDFVAVGPVTPPSDRLVISFVGVLKHGNPLTVLRAVARFLQQRPQARHQLEIRWIGLVRPEHRRMVEELELQEVVRSFGYVPHRQAVRYMLESHVLWAENRPLGSPVKVFEYLGARRTLLVCTPLHSPIQPLIEACGAAFWAEPGDVSTMARHIAELYERWRDGSLPVPSEEFVQSFDRRLLTGELARLLSLHAAL